MQNGSSSQEMPRQVQKRLVVGISGVTCGGKTTVSKLLQASFPWAKIIHQDAYFHPNDAKFHVYIPELNYYNWELETALNFAKMERDLKHAMEGNRDFVATGPPFFANMDFVRVHEPCQVEVQNYVKQFSNIQLVIIEGHAIFNQAFLDEACNLKFFITLDRQECWRRRQERAYNPQPPAGFFEMCVWPSYAQRLMEVQQMLSVNFIDAKQVHLVEIYREIKNSIINMMTEMM